jgi:catechol 2,3-dioxygenase-like lactoylglutathione lyase family enzyme
MEFTLHASLPASDIDRARAWYSEKLGLEPIEAGPGGDLRYDTGSTQFGIYPSAFAGSNRATAAVLVVSDFDAARAELRSKGVVFEDYDFGEEFRTIDGVMETPDGFKTSWFKDSEGNILGLGAM